MRLVVLDTNVVVSAAIKPGRAPARLVMDWLLEGQVQAVVCLGIVQEYREVMRRPKFRRHNLPPHWLDFLIEESLQLPDPEPWPHTLPDPKDGHFIATAHAAGAWLVSANLKHFPPAGRGDVVVVSPADYLVYLESRQERGTVALRRTQE